MLRMMVAPKEHCLTVPLTSPHGHTTRCRIAASDAAGWDVRLEVDACVVAQTHCGDWHHVERLCSTVSSTWLGCHTERSARR
jgi:hypothetical protein